MIDDDTYVCSECGTGWNTVTAADECATIDSAEARQIRAAEKKRKPWDSNIVRSVN